MLAITPITTNQSAMSRDTNFRPRHLTKTGSIAVETSRSMHKLLKKNNDFAHPHIPLTFW